MSNEGVFSEAIKEFAEKTEEKITEVWHESLRSLDEHIASLVPVKTGNLRNSRDVSTMGQFGIDWDTKKFRDPSDRINNEIAGAEVGGKVFFGFRAPYARLTESRSGFLRLASQRWHGVVEDAVNKVKE